MLKHGWTAGKMAPSYGVAHAAWDGKELYRKKYQILTNPGWKSHLVWMKNDGNSVPSGAVVAGKDGGNASRLVYIQVKFTNRRINFTKCSFCSISLQKSVLHERRLEMVN